MGEEGGLAGGGTVDTQLGGALTQGGVHQQHPPASVQHRGGAAPGHLPQPSGQTGEGEHLTGAGGSVSQHLAHGPLALVGVLLGHQQQAALGRGRPQPLQQFSSYFLPRPGIQ